MITCSSPRVEASHTIVPTSLTASLSLPGPGDPVNAEYWLSKTMTALSTAEFVRNVGSSGCTPGLTTAMPPRLACTYEVKLVKNIAGEPLNPEGLLSHPSPVEPVHFS